MPKMTSLEELKKGVKKIKLNKNKFTLIDNEDFKRLSHWKWTFDGRYVGYYSFKKKQRFWLHRVIMEARTGQIVDHINGNKLDNRRENLRIVTPTQSMMNRNVKGYYFHKQYSKWHAKIGLNYKTISLGFFNTEKEAKQARIEAELKYFGVYART